MRHTLYIPGCYYKFVSSSVELLHHHKGIFKILSASKLDFEPDERLVSIKLRGRDPELVRLSVIRKCCEQVPDVVGLIEIGE